MTADEARKLATERHSIVRRWLDRIAEAAHRGHFSINTTETPPRPEQVSALEALGYVVTIEPIPTSTLKLTTITWE